jgi:hypothetical protein
MTSDVLIGAAISLVTSLGTSWYVAEKYFRRQRGLDEEKEKHEVQLSFNRLVNANYAVLRKRLKGSPHLRDAMTEFETKLKIYRPDWDAKETIEAAAEQAQQTIDEHPGDFEDVEKVEAVFPQREITNRQ